MRGLGVVRTVRGRRRRRRRERRKEMWMLGRCIFGGLRVF